MLVRIVCTHVFVRVFVCGGGRKDRMDVNVVR